MKGCAPSLALTMRHNVTRKWPITQGNITMNKPTTKEKAGVRAKILLPLAKISKSKNIGDN